MEVNMNQTRPNQIPRKRKRKSKFALILKTSFFMIGFGIACIIMLSFLYVFLHLDMKRFNVSIFNKPKTVENIGDTKIQEMLLTPNPYSRPQTPLWIVNGVVIHYTANPGTSAEANRNYFEGLKNSKVTSSSSHFVIGLDGEIIQCIPLNEISFASNNRNGDTISIECCHPDETGEFTKETYDSLVKLTTWLCINYNLKEKDILRHYDVSEKLCPLYYVENEDKWNDFKKEITRNINEDTNENFEEYDINYLIKQ